MKIAKESLRVAGKPVGDLFVVEGVDRREVSVDHRFLEFVNTRRELSFINRYTLRQFEEEVRRQPQLESSEGAADGQPRE